ncbi:tail length tape measure protein [Arthrobacter phage Eileen]|uniref:Tape measure protein n=2 Tax=Bridgettevirus TaxID=2733170 RepID=A0A3G2KI83_9CAUD|nr:tail length tape measure protein [Arthrobacter phage Eileen]YP_009815568.1 tail length tape measure protein [Arthrobacter phage Peas]AYN57807.1 tape measure protein [Arthrobacter phage Eileen]AYN58705.1 tape measure protein [Arthrobacter phage Peas]
MATRSISIALEAKVQGFVSGLRTAQQAANDFGRRSAEFAKNHEQDMDRVGKAGMLMGGGLLAGVGVAVKSFMDFDKAMSEVQASTHETAGNMDMLRDAAIRAGADTAFSAAEAANAIDEMAKAGVSTSNILGGGLAGALSLAAAGSMGVGDAAELAATAMTQFKLQGQDLPHVADLLAAGAGKAQGSVSDIGMALKQSGLVADMFGVSIEETVGSLAAFASAGLVGSDAGTSFKQSLLMLAKPSKEAQATLDELGISTHDVNGKFVGMANLAGQLKEKMGPLTDAQRQQAMATIFGADAIRVANALYDQGADGIAAWTDKVNDAGFAAETAALKQDNLAGDFEKLTGSIDSVFIKSASGANGALRGLVQSAEDFVDSIGSIPEPVLQAGLGIAGATGLVLLAGGAFTSTVPKIMEGVEAFKKLEKAAPRAAGALKGAGLVAGMFAVAGALGAIDTAITDSQIERSVGRTTSALIELSKQSGNIQQCSILLDDLFQKKDGSALISGVTDLDSAMTRMFRKDWQQSFSDWGESMLKPIANMMGVKGAAQELDESFKTIDDQLAAFVKSGNSDIAAKAFKQLEERAALKGIKPDELKSKFSGYSEALKQADADAQLAAEGVEKLKTSTGTVVPISPEVQKSLEDIGISAQGAVVALDKYASALVRAGLSNLSISDAARNVQAAIDGVTDSIATNGTTLDINTAAGRANQAALEGVASAGLQQVETMSKATDAYGQNIYTSDQLQASMYGTYQAMITAAGQFGITGDAADSLARKALGIPPKVDVKAYLQDFASKQLDNVGAKVDNLNGKTANVYTNYYETTIQKVIRELSGDTGAPVGAGTVLAPKRRAGGGPVFGPGSGTSDDIPAMLSNGEHVWTAQEVAAAGGQAVVERMRALAKAGLLPKFATGGAVAGHLGESANARANRIYREQSKLTAEQRKRQAEIATYRRDTWLDYQKDTRRGKGVRSVTESMSAAESYADRLTAIADSGNVGAASVRNLYTAAGKGEAGLRALHARADKLSVSLEKAKDRVTSLSQTRDNIRGQLSGEFSISDAMKNTSPFKAITLQGIQGAANAVLARIRTFAGKLNKLRAMGYSGAVLEEIAGLGSVEGMVAADALLKGSKADVKNLNGVYGSIDAASKAAGTYVTDAMYKGGINAANGLVKGLQSQEKAIEQQMLKIGLGMEGALKKALGIRSPSRKAAAIGDNFAGTLAHRLQAGKGNVAKHAAALGDAMSVVPKSYTPAITYRPLPASQAGQQGPTQMTGTLVMDSGEILGVFNGVAVSAIKDADSQSQYTRTGRR